GALARRFESVWLTYLLARLPDPLRPRTGASNHLDKPEAETIQRAIVTASIAGLGLLDSFGIRAAVAVGHSLGEVAALRWAGAFDDSTSLRIASARARAMNEAQSPDGSMAAITASQQAVEALLNGDQVFLACVNSPHQTVVSGASSAVEKFVDRVRRNGPS